MTTREERFWSTMRGYTRARIGIGRAGATGLPTNALLRFQADVAQARDAVHRPVDFEDIKRHLPDLATIQVSSQAVDRATYLRRPDLGRRLKDADREYLRSLDGSWDIVFVIADGLSFTAAERQGPPLLLACLARLQNWRIAPIVLASQARVALGDDIAEAMGARAVAMLIGERPGLMAADSLSVYLTWNVHVGSADSQRNCISNIHEAGLAIDVAADRTVWLAREMLRLGISGVGLKEQADTPLLQPPAGQS